MANRVICALLLLPLILPPGIASAQQLPNIPAALAGQIDHDRELAEGYVRLVKKEWSPESKLYKSANQRYVEAQAAYAGCIGELRARMINASAGKYNPNESAPPQCDKASRLAANFTDLVRKMSSDQSKNVAPLLTNLIAPAGNFIKSMFEAWETYERTKGVKADSMSKWNEVVTHVADEFSKRASWQPWEKI